MKRYLLLIIFLGCANVPSIQHFNTREEAMKWVYTTVTYKSDMEQWNVSDVWQTPETTLKLKTGDCEDYSILFMSILHDQFGDFPEMLSVKIPGTNHAVVRSAGVIYDPTFGIMRERVDMLWVYEFDFVMFLAGLSDVFI